MAFITHAAKSPLCVPQSLRPSVTTCPRRSGARATVMTTTERVSGQAAQNRAESQYHQLSRMTTIVEDTGDINTIARDKPHSATTNPSLVAKAAADEAYEPLVASAVAYGRKRGSALSAADELTLVRNQLFVAFGKQILQHVPGDVSTEVDARLSFDTDAQVSVARSLIAMYEEVDVPRDRVLIKLASTWEGIEACRVLQAEGIRTNMTLLFCLAQAAAAADAGAYLVSPFVGRIRDWFVNTQGVDEFRPEDDPGVKSVQSIYRYYKCHGYDTVVMGASFRNKGEILQLAGCDRLTISPGFIKDLMETHEDVPRVLVPPDLGVCEAVDKLHLDQNQFRWLLNEDAMATEKLAEGIRKFAADLETLDRKLEKLLA